MACRAIRRSEGPGSPASIVRARCSASCGRDTASESKIKRLVIFPLGQSRHIATSLATTSRTGKSNSVYRTNRHSGWHLFPPGSVGVSDSVKVESDVLSDPMLEGSIRWIP